MSNIRIQPVMEVITNGVITYRKGTIDPVADFNAGYRATHWEVWDDNQTPPKMLIRANEFNKAWRVASKAAG